ncbi:MAG TPA: glycine oxidase ThiO [Pirellulales bacterium]|jgi:glycine oxidase|nr:glycine oxidase ThiO [Pirellulales bacterium]
MHDCLIIGGGVVGLSLAYELARAGKRVCVIDRRRVGREASWAGAGILPPAPPNDTSDPLCHLERLSGELHRRWAEELRATTGIDTGYRRSGGLHVAFDDETELALRSTMTERVVAGVDVKELSSTGVARIEPALAPARCGFLLNDECQIRNPRHLKALEAGCALRGVDVITGVEAIDFDMHGDRVEGLRTSGETLEAARYCICGGAWSGALLARLGCNLNTRPVRGQMALLNTAPFLLWHIVNEGQRYIVPRGDGRFLVGSTVEDIGFDCRTTAGGIGGLLEFARRLVPQLAAAELEQCWAGLRPGTVDGLPYLGKVPGVANAFVAAGHFRAGLHLSTGTARVMSQVLRDVEPDIDLLPFRVDRT